MKDWKKVKLGTLLTESKVVSENPNTDKRIRVKLNVLGVEKRPNTKDKKGATKYYIRKAGQFVYGKQNLHKGAFGIISDELDGFESSLDIPAFDIDDTCYPEWIFYFFKKANLYLKLEILAKGVGSKRIHPKQIFELDIFLPSKEEQRKVLDEIKKVEKNNQKLVKEIVSQEENLSKLRQSILQDGIRGELTKEWRKQNTSIEPASELLKIIKTEKKQLVKENKIKKEKPLLPIDKEEIPFEIPESWEYTRLGEIAEFISSGSRGWAKYYSNKGAKFIRMGNLSKNSLEMRFDNIQFVNPPTKGEGTRSRLQKNDYLVSITGDVGMLGKVPDNFGEAYINQHTALVRILSILRNNFIDIILLSPYSAEQFNAPQRGIKNSFRLSDLKEIVLTLPPLEEQKAIVEKVNQLIANCNTLEQEINKSKTYAEKLMLSVLSELLGEENNILLSKVPTKKETNKPLREIKYNSKTVHMDLVKLLKENGKLHAEDLWKMSKHLNDIDAFYAELKEQIEEGKTIKESEEKGYLELV